MRRAFSVFMVLLSSGSYADYADRSTFAKCEEGFSIEVGSYNVISGKPQLFGQYMYADLSKEDKKFVQKSGDISCNVGGKKVSVSFGQSEPLSHGECGATPIGYISVSFDGKKIFDMAKMNVDCFDAVNGIKIHTYDGKPENLRYEICGHTDKVYSFGVDGCLTYRNEMFNRLPIPLTGFSSSLIVSESEL